MLLLTSAIPPSISPVTPTRLSANYNEAKAQLEQLKGDKLNIKEKIGLKLAAKQMQKDTNAGGGRKSQLLAEIVYT
jgi:hypothetical protein